MEKGWIWWKKYLCLYHWIWKDWWNKINFSHSGKVGESHPESGKEVPPLSRFFITTVETEASFLFSASFFYWFLKAVVTNTMNVKNHRQIVEEHFDRCLKEQQLTFQEAKTIANTFNNYDPRLCAAVRNFVSSSLHTIGPEEVRSLIGVGYKKIRGLVRNKIN